MSRVSITLPEARNLLKRALERRAAFLGAPPSDGVRLLGPGDNSPILTLDRYGPGAVMTVADGPNEVTPDVRVLAEALLPQVAAIAVTSIYYKPLPRDRSQLGGAMPPAMTDPNPAVGPPLPDAIIVTEGSANLEVRLHDGFSTGLFFDQRENRRALAELCRPKWNVLNTFAYTGAFSVACARAGAKTTTVDISKKYLEWAERNFAHNAIDTKDHFFNRVDTFEFFRLARRKNLRFDLIILDPPTFAAGSKRDDVAPFSAEKDYPRLLTEAVELLAPNGRVFASTNSRTLCEGRFRPMIEKTFGRRPMYAKMPAPPIDLAGEHGRLAAELFTLR